MQSQKAVPYILALHYSIVGLALLLTIFEFCDF